MEAIIETGGKQIVVREGEKLRVERIKSDSETVVFENVLLLKDKDKVIVGSPYIKGAKVFAKLLGEEKGKKIIVFRKKAKTGYKKKRGHRQIYSIIQIDKIKVEEN